MSPATPSVLAVIEIGFEPMLRLGELTIRWQTIGVTVALLVALVLASVRAPEVIGRRAPLDDLVLIAIGIVPGAVIGGRLVHATAFWDAYAAQPIAIVDPGIGSLSLLGAVLGGALSAAYVALLLGAPVRRWADAGAAPLLMAIALGKFAQFVGGSGQGLPFDGQWAVSFVGSGPWVSANPEVPSHPSQIYEALWAAIAIPLVMWWPDRLLKVGRLLYGALSWFLLGRVLIGFTWRDDQTIGPLNTEQLFALAALIVLQLIRFRPRRRVRLPAP